MAKVIASSAEEERGGQIHKKMEGNYLTSGDLAMWDTARTSRAGNYYGDGYGCGYGHHGRGMAATGIALGAGSLGIAVFGGLALAFGLNAASKARARGAENQANANAKTIELLAATMNREATRQDSINVDVTQTLRNHSSAFGTGGSAAANALATAEAQALLLNSGFGSSRSGQVCPQPVALYQPAMPCRCNTCGD